MPKPNAQPPLDFEGQQPSDALFARRCRCTPPRTRPSTPTGKRWQCEVCGSWWELQGAELRRPTGSAPGTPYLPVRSWGRVPA